MKISIDELDGDALDRAVTTAVPLDLPFNVRLQPSTNWAHGGPLVEKYINTLEYQNCGSNDWMAVGDSLHYGPTPLIAACRTIVCDKLGGPMVEVDL